MSLENQGVFQLLKEVTFHFSKALICGSFARRWDGSRGSGFYIPSRKAQ